MEILKVEHIKNPRVSGLLPEENEKDWIFGAIANRIILQPDRNWVQFITELNDLQRNGLFDEYCCVLHGIINGVQCVVKKKWGITLDLSKRFLAILTGVVPGQGTSIRAGAETLRTKGVCLEADYPTITPTMTALEFYKALTPEILAKEFFLKTGYTYQHENLPFGTLWQGAIADTIDNGLQYSPVIVAIEGQYNFDNEGRLQYSGNPYSHVVLVVASYPDYFLVLDSENPNGLMKVRRDYAFNSPKVFYIEKKTSMKIKVLGNNAVFSINPLNNRLVPYGDGDVLKLMENTTEYKDIKVFNTVEELLREYQFDNWMAAKVSWDSQTFIDLFRKKN